MGIARGYLGDYWPPTVSVGQIKTLPTSFFASLVPGENTIGGWLGGILGKMLGCLHLGLSRYLCGWGYLTYGCFQPYRNSCAGDREEPRPSTGLGLCHPSPYSYPGDLHGFLWGLQQGQRWGMGGGGELLQQLPVTGRQG